MTPTESLLHCLLHDVRLLTLAQIKRLPSLSSSETHVSDELLEELIEARLINNTSMLARPVLSLNAPLLSWNPTKPQQLPEFGRASYRMMKRWKSLPAPTPIFTATTKASRLYGGYAASGSLRPSEISHDVHVSETYLHYRKQLISRNDNHEWIGENRLRREQAGETFFAGHIPDGIIRQCNSTAPSLVVDFGGAYSKAKLQDMHDAFKPFSYAIW